ncbi:thiamine phosphate synthase [Sneathiella chungangensis]|uniref:Thiamine-phosphate synthase n=1 Tax=Sneathiella chungangensis TaxID=1418234 RepID=A0A845MFK6_9PROT|nr:thiamine phosphate synthase [Sneathiella chungangensis]MZR22086.1 thiamine phosphate synthase [Sneathiella chungangensis]
MGTVPNVGRERPRLYLISPPEIDLDTFETAFREALAGGDVACFQLRLKDRPATEIIAATKRLMPIAEQAGVAFLLNDDVELARELTVDGVHVGQDDMPYKKARALLGPDAIIGVTCKNSKHLAMTAGEAGADYVAFGAFFPSTTKAETVKADPEILGWWSETTLIPSVAIGGITVENAEILLKSGADFLAVSSGVWDFESGPKDAVAAFNQVIDKVMTSW